MSIPAIRFLTRETRLTKKREKEETRLTKEREQEETELIKNTVSLLTPVFAKIRGLISNCLQMVEKSENELNAYNAGVREFNEIAARLKKLDPSSYEELIIGRHSEFSYEDLMKSGTN